MVPPTESNVSLMSEEEREARGIGSLPGSLYEAVLLAERSDVVRRALGEHTFHTFIQNKHIEWEQYRSAVTDYEIKRYLPVL